MFAYSIYTRLIKLSCIQIMFRLWFLLQNNYCTLAAIEKELVVSDVCILDGGAPTCEQFSLRVVYVSS